MKKALVCLSVLVFTAFGLCACMPFSAETEGKGTPHEIVGGWRHSEITSIELLADAQGGKEAIYRMYYTIYDYIFLANGKGYGRVFSGDDTVYESDLVVTVGNHGKQFSFTYKVKNDSLAIKTKTSLLQGTFVIDDGVLTISDEFNPEKPMNFDRIV